MKSVLCVLAVSALAVSSPVCVSAQSFCDRYTIATHSGSNTGADQQDLFFQVVARAVLGKNDSTPVVNSIAFGPGLAQYFDGSINYRDGLPASALPNFPAENRTVAPNFVQSYLDNGTTPGTPFTTLAVHLIAFFGGVLGCKATGFPDYATIGGVSDFTNLHKGMVINRAAFSYFNDAVVNSMSSFGVAKNDTDFVNATLTNTFTRAEGSANVICNQADCPCAPKFKAEGTKCVAEAVSSSTGGALSSSSSSTAPNSTVPASASSRAPAAGMIVAAFAMVATLLL